MRFGNYTPNLLTRACHKAMQNSHKHLKISQLRENTSTEENKIKQIAFYLECSVFPT